MLRKRANRCRIEGQLEVEEEGKRKCTIGSEKQGKQMLRKRVTRC